MRDDKLGHLLRMLPTPDSVHGGRVPREGVAGNPTVRKDKDRATLENYNPFLYIDFIIVSPLSIILTFLGS